MTEELSTTRDKLHLVWNSLCTAKANLNNIDTADVNDNIASFIGLAMQQVRKELGYTKDD